MTDPFQPLTVRDIPRLTRYFSARGTRLCNDSAGAAVLWQPYFQDAALELDGTLVLREQFPGLGTVFSTPIGENVGNAYDFLANYCREVGQPLQFFPATDADVENLRARFGVVEVTPVRAWFDYLYDAQDMVSFRGRRFNGQRNHIHHFQRLYPDWSFERVTAQNLPEVCAFFDDFTRRYHKDSAGLLNQEYFDPEVVTSPQEAFYARKISLPIEETQGRVCSEFVMCYPPGIPVLAPGERITQEILDYIEYAKNKGCSMTGPEDPEIRALNVIA